MDGATLKFYIKKEYDKHFWNLNFVCAVPILLPKKLLVIFEHFFEELPNKENKNKGKIKNV